MFLKFRFCAAHTNMCGATPLRLRFAIGGRHSCSIHISNGVVLRRDRWLVRAELTRVMFILQSKIAYIFSRNHTAMPNPCGSEELVGIPKR